MALVLYPLLSTALFYLGSRAKITSWLWSKYPPKLAALMDCSACLGFWLGLVIAIVVGRGLELSILSLDPLHWATPIFVALCSLVWTPLTAALMQRSLEILGTVVTEE